MPLIQLKKFWTPLELFGFEIYRSEENQWFIKRRGKPLKKLF